MPLKLWATLIFLRQRPERLSHAQKFVRRNGIETHESLPVGFFVLTKDKMVAAQENPLVRVPIFFSKVSRRKKLET